MATTNEQPALESLGGIPVRCAAAPVGLSDAQRAAALLEVQVALAVVRRRERDREALAGVRAGAGK